MFKHSKHLFVSILSSFIITTTHAVEALSDDALQQKEISLVADNVADCSHDTSNDKSKDEHKKSACSEQTALSDANLVDKVINASIVADSDNLESLQKAINNFNKSAVNLDANAVQVLKEQIKNLQNIQMNSDGTLALKINVPPNAFESYIYQRINKETDLEIMNISPGIREIEVKTFK